MYNIKFALLKFLRPNNFRIQYTQKYSCQYSHKHASVKDTHLQQTGIHVT